MTRPGQPLLHVSRVGAGPVVPTDYVSLLGSNLVTLWHQGHGVALGSGSSINQWNDVVSNRAAPHLGPGTAPQLLVDPGYFASKPVVHFSASSTKLATAVATLVPAEARPYVFCVSRWRDGEGAYPYVWSLNASDDMVHFTGGVAGPQLLQFKQPGTTYASGPAHDTQQHFNSAWLDGTLGHFTADGTDYTVAATGSIVPAVTQARLASGPGNLSMYLWGLCTAAPDSTTRAQLAALVAEDLA